MADHSKPLVTSTYANFVTELDERFDDIAKGLDPATTTPTNLPTGAIRWNSASSKWEKWSGTAWADLAASYNINLAGPLTLTANSSSDALRITQTGAGNALVVEDSANPDSTPFVVNASGQVVVGNATALGSSSNFQILGSGSAASSQSIARFGGNAFPPNIYLSKSRGANIGDNGIVSNGDALGQIGFFGNDGSSSVYAALIQSEVDGTPGTNDMPGRLVFSTTADGASTPTERMRIRSDGNIGIGGSGSGAVSFYNQKTITGGTTSYGNYTNSTVQSDVTTYGVGNRTALSTAAASFSTSLFCYWASQGTIGAGSSVTNQYGFYTDAQLTGATNNYGFYSAIASGTGRWNFYAAGTADNYFAGKVLFGTTAARAFDTGTTTFTPTLQQEGTDASTSSISLARNSANVGAPYLAFGKSRSASVGGVTAVQSGDTLGTITFQGADGTKLIEGASIDVIVDGTPGTNDMPGRLVFSTTADGASTPTERLRIDSAGRCDMQSNMGATGSGGASSISGTTLTVGGTITGTFNVGDRIFGAGVEQNTFIIALGTGTGGAGTYTINNSQTVSSRSIYALGGGVNVFRFTDTDTTTASNQPMGFIEWYGSDASTPGAGVKAYIAGISESTIPDSALIFGTSDNVASTQAKERMRIDSSGNLLVGTTVASSMSDPGFKVFPSATTPSAGLVFDINAGNYFGFTLYNVNATYNGYRFYVGTDGGIRNYSANNVNLSDERVKTNIELSGNYLDKICAIPVKLFNYKDEQETTQKSLGVIAQDVEKIAPELVNSSDGFGETPDDGVPLKTIYQTDLQYALMKCIQELKAELDATKAEVAALKGIK